MDNETLTETENSNQSKTLIIVTAIAGVTVLGAKLVSVFRNRKVTETETETTTEIA